MFKSPVYGVIPVPIERIRGNVYNPNNVAPPEMKLLYESIKEDGYTMPVVVFPIDDPDYDYEIVDGFHRHLVMMTHKDIYDREQGLLPCSILNKEVSDRMASTIRHNRARGTHDVKLMQGIVAELVQMGKGDLWIMKKLGMTADEVLRMKQLTGLQSLFKDREFSKAWQPEEK